MTKVQRQVVTNFLICEDAKLVIKLTKKKATEIEKHMYNFCVYLAQKYSEDVDELYEKHAYEKVGEIMKYPGQLENIINDIKDHVIGWDSCVYTQIHEKLHKDIVDQVHGPKIVEGSLQCKNYKCKSFECTYYQTQSRSMDEGFTTHVECKKCGNKYVIT